MSTRYGSPKIAWSVLAAVLLAIVAVAALALLQDSRRPASIERVEARSDAISVVVVVRHNSCANHQPDVSVQQDEETISLKASFDESGSCDDVMVSSAVSVALDEPLGRRNVVVSTVNQGEPLICVIDGEPSERCIQR